MRRSLNGWLAVVALVFAVAAPGRAQDADALLKSAKGKMEKYDPTGAMEDMDKAIALKGDSAELFTVRGEARIMAFVMKKAGEEAKTGALADFNKAIELDPKYDMGYAGRAGYEFFGNDLDAALADYDKAIVCSAKPAEIYVARASLKKHMGNVDGAMADYAEAISLEPAGKPAFRAYHERSSFKREQGDLNGALADLEKCMTMDGESDFMRSLDAYDCGCMKEDTGDLDGALKDFDSAISLHAKAGEDYFPETYAARFVARVEKGDMAGAREDFTKWVGKDEVIVDDASLSDPEMMSLVERNAARLDAACTKLLETEPDDRALHYVRAYARYAEGLYADSVADFKKEQAAMKIKMGSTQYYTSFFVWLERSKLGEQKEALAELQQRYSEPDYDFMQTWPREIAAFLTGKESEEDFLDASKKEHQFVSKEDQECTAYFFAGAKRLVAGDKDGAKRFFEKSAKAGTLGNLEEAAAKVELKGLVK